MLHIKLFPAEYVDTYWCHGDQIHHWRDQIQFHQSFLELRKLLKYEFSDFKFQAEQRKKHHPRGIYRYVSQLHWVIDAYGTSLHRIKDIILK